MTTYLFSCFNNSWCFLSWHFRRIVFPYRLIQSELSSVGKGWPLILLLSVWYWPRTKVHITIEQCFLTFSVHYPYDQASHVSLPLVKTNIVYMRHSTPSRTVWKILIFDFLYFWHFLVPIKKLFLVNFEIFLVTGLREIEFRVFAHNFFKNGTNSTIFFFLNFFVFLQTSFGWD